jgi:hypothetical protein
VYSPVSQATSKWAIVLVPTLEDRYLVDLPCRRYWDGMESMGNYYKYLFTFKTILKSYYFFSKIVYDSVKIL